MSPGRAKLVQGAHGGFVRAAQLLGGGQAVRVALPYGDGVSAPLILEEMPGPSAADSREQSQLAVADLAALTQALQHWGDQDDEDGNVTQITDSLGDTVTSQYDGGNLVQRGYSGPNVQLLLTIP